MNKFRAFDKKRKVYAAVGFMITGATLTQNKLVEYCEKYKTKGKEVSERLQDLIIEQFTGLGIELPTGKYHEVYEGDVFHMPVYNESLVVAWDDEEFKWCLVNVSNKRRYGLTYLQSERVICGIDKVETKYDIGSVGWKPGARLKSKSTDMDCVDKKTYDMISVHYKGINIF